MIFGDVDVGAIKPRTDVNIWGQALILDVKSQLDVGEEVRFDVGYSALIRAMMLPYVEKVYLSTSKKSLGFKKKADMKLMKEQLYMTRWVSM